VLQVLSLSGMLREGRQIDGFAFHAVDGMENPEGYALKGDGPGQFGYFRRRKPVGTMEKVDFKVRVAYLGDDFAGVCGAFVRARKEGGGVKRLAAL